MQHTRGTIVAAQEGRFRLVTADGRYKLFVLAHDAALEPQQLEALVDGQELVVEHSDLPGKIAGLAHRIEGRSGR